jgi:UDP-N-acetylmuramyl tripeptide synthase
MVNFLGTLIGKTIRLLLSFRLNGGHALPGLVVEKLLPSYVPCMLSTPPEGVVIITGTNGKTTTTKIVAHILKANGKKVLTNSTGSNLVRGIASSLAQHASWMGRLKQDIAILEVDEATARALVKQVRPRWVLGLNVSRDQLDRYGEVDTVASYIGTAMAAASKGIIANAADPHLHKIASRVAEAKKISLWYFGFSDKLAKFFPSDYDIAAVGQIRPSQKATIKPDVELVNFSGQKVTYRIGEAEYNTQLKLTGQHNFLNGAAALALCCQLLPEKPPGELVSELSQVDLAFGRGERYRLHNGAEIELVLVKNPASFTQALASYAAAKPSLMIAINDNIADGRDVSWLWDVNFAPLQGQAVAITSGSRGADIALRLSYDGIPVAEILPPLPKALRRLSRLEGSKVILATYTAMLSLYKELNNKGVKIS